MPANPVVILNLFQDPFRALPCASWVNRGRGLSAALSGAGGTMDPETSSGWRSRAG